MRKIKTIYIGRMVTIATIVSFLILSCTPVKPADNLNPGALPGLQTGPAPWPAEINQLRQRLQDINLPALSTEGEVLHIHQHLDISIDGKPVQVPADIGINETQGFISSIHTHDLTGIIHVESPTIQVFTLGQFFDTWGVRFTAYCIGGYCNTPDKSLKVYVNGKLSSADPRDIVLEDHEEIFVFFGSADEVPVQIPSTFSFPPGY